MAPTDDEIREMAKARVSFRAHAIAYVLVNALLVGIWWFGGDATRLDMGGMAFTDSDRGSFWPIWSILGWGVGLGFHAYNAYGGGAGALAREEAKLREKLRKG